MISCSEAVRQLWEYLEQDLAATERDRVDQHLAFCRRCCGEAEFAAELRTLLRSATGPVALPAPVESRLVAFLDALEEDA
ncbi:MAG: zf-HC2 domain-containing protein [Egibacteraceae bacterium]